LFSIFSNTDAHYSFLALFDFGSSAHVDLSRLDDKRIRDGFHNSVGNRKRDEIGAYAATVNTRRYDRKREEKCGSAGG
jgi:hypothetical protein